LLLKINCSEADVATKLVANTEDLELIAVCEKPNGAVMKGWRFEVFGRDALALKEGKLSLGLKDGRIYKRYA
jgi:ribonuclease D